MKLPAPASFSGAPIEFNEPLFLDLRWARTTEQVSLRQPRMQEAVANLAAPLHGKPKDELVGTDIREHRRTLCLAWGAGIGLFLLTALAVIAPLYANHQRLAAERYARNSLDRALSAQSVTNHVARPVKSLLLAVEAVQVTRTVDALVLSEAEEALRSALAYMSASMPLNGHGARVLDAVFSDVEKLVKLGCRLAGRQLSREEWVQFRPGQAYNPQCVGE